MNRSDEMKRKPAGPKHRNLYAWHGSIWCAAVGFLIAASGCEVDRYDPAAQCLAMASDAKACAEPVDYGAVSTRDCRTAVYLRLRSEAMGDPPRALSDSEEAEIKMAAIEPCDSPEKAWRTVCKARASSEAELARCARDCEKQAHETWSGSKRMEWSACKFLLPELERED
jgi:hypothetical protein